MKKHPEIVEQIQKKSIESVFTVASSLQEGMSEKDIELQIQQEMAKHDLKQFWYDVPIFVLIGEDRFQTIAASDYDKKKPSTRILLKKGDSIFFDVHPQNEDGVWGDFSHTLVFQPQPTDDEKVDFLELMFTIHTNGIKEISSDTSGSYLYNWYIEEYRKHSIVHQDKRGTIGHEVISGPKLDENGNYRIAFIDKFSNAPLEEGVYTIEPGGYKQNLNNDGILVGRFEDCVYIPKTGKAVVLGRTKNLPLTV